MAKMRTPQIWKANNFGFHQKTRKLSLVTKKATKAAIRLVRIVNIH